jgi:hypothetical protein
LSGTHNRRGIWTPEACVQLEKLPACNSLKVVPNTKNISKINSQPQHYQWNMAKMQKINTASWGIKIGRKPKLINNIK